MPEFAHECKISGREAESKLSDREPFPGNSHPRAERKNDDPVEIEFGYGFGDKNSAEVNGGHEPRGLGISEEDLAVADNEILEHLNQDLTRVEELEELLEGESGGHVSVLRLSAETQRCDDFKDSHPLLEWGVGILCFPQTSSSSWN